MSHAQRIAACRIAARCIASATLCLPMPAAAQADGAAPPRQLVTVLHAHSAASTGEEDLGGLIRRAAASGIDVLVLHENLGYEFRYAPAFLRLFGEARMAAPTIESYGVERYLRELEAARRGTDDVVVLAGVEVPPYYYWSGSLLRGDLTLHDMQRNLLILPPIGDRADADTADFLAALPAVGNRLQRRFGWQSALLLLPGLLLVGIATWKLRQRSRAATSDPGRWRWGLAAVAGAALLWLNFPFTVAPRPPYDTEAGIVPAQQLIDYTEQHGGLALWSMPEAVDDRRQAIGPFSVHLSTRPYPEALAASTGYTGFGGVYADTTGTWEAGGTWDRLLLAHQAGERRQAPWLFGESAYHYAGQAGKQLGDVLTVLLVDVASEAGVFAALESGRGYAVRRDGGVVDLRLQDFAVAAAHPTAESTPAAVIAPLSTSAGEQAGAGAVARIGDTLVLPPGRDAVELVVDVAEASGGAAAVRIELVCNGEVIRRLEGTTPLRQRWNETLAPDLPAAYFRVVVRGERPAHLVSNPIFVRRDDGALRPSVSR